MNIENHLLFYLKANNREFGNSSRKIMTYYTGIDGGNNPSGNTNNLKQVDYYLGDVIMITDSFKYNINNLIIEQNTTYYE